MELLLELDYYTVRQAIGAGYLLALFLPIAAVYLFRKNLTLPYKEDDTGLHDRQTQTKMKVFSRPLCSGPRFFCLLVRRIEGPDDADTPSHLQIV